MNNKKKYEFGSIQSLELSEIVVDIYAVEEESAVDAPQFYPMNGEIDFSDTEKFNRIAMAGPFTSP